MTNIKSGIYKITNPNNQIYIGQSINLRRRLTSYMKLYATVQSQKRIFESLTKHGPKQHKFEVIEFCSVYELDAQEVHYKKEHIDNYGWETALFCQVYDAPTKGRKRAEQDYYNQYGRPYKPTLYQEFINFMEGEGEEFIINYDIGHQPYDTLKPEVKEWIADNGEVATEEVDDDVEEIDDIRVWRKRRKLLNFYDRGLMSQC